MDSVILNIICTVWCAIICSWSIIISTFCEINDLSRTISSYVLLYFFTLMNIAAYNNIQLSIYYYIPYSGYFSRGINFRGFRGQLASAKN